MTKQTEALHKALKVLNCLNNDRVYETAWVKGAINSCEEALEQPAQEPVAWKHFDKAYSKACNSSQPQDWMDAALLAQQARNTHPAPSWQGLSDDELNKIIEKHKLMWVTVDFARAIEQALMEKNNGTA